MANTKPVAINDLTQAMAAMGQAPERAERDLDRAVAALAKAAPSAVEAMKALGLSALAAVEAAGAMQEAWRKANGNRP